MEEEFSAAAYTWRGRRPFRHDRREPSGVLVMRDRFDAAIAAEARRAGAVLVEGAPVSSVVRDGDRMVVDARYEGRVVIGADGVRSAVRRAAGLGELTRGAAIESEIPTSHTAHGTIAVDFGRLPWGYAWSFPKRRGLSVGMLSYAPGGGDLRRRFEEYRRDLGVAGGETAGWEIPAGGDDGPFHGDGILLTGDAAGLVDALTGEGIYYAVRSGQIAGQVAAEGAPPEVHTRRVREEIVTELSVARRLAAAFYAHPRLAYELGVRSRRVNEAMMDALMGRRSYADVRKFLKSGWPARLFGWMKSSAGSGGPL